MTKDKYELVSIVPKKHKGTLIKAVADPAAGDR